jgi:molecular chaperone Hsp33
MTAPADLTERFLLENLDIRGQVVRLGPLWRAIESRRDYPDELLGLLGEFAALAVLIGSGLKHPGRAVLQVIGQGPISLAVADCTRELALRAMVKAKAAPTPDPSRASGRGEQPTIHDWFPSGRLVLTIENAQTARHFQSIVPLEGATLAECFERYFDRSEQVPTHLWVRASRDSVGALILQKLPKADEKDATGWARVQQLAAQRAPHALATGGEGPPADVAALLTTLFPEDDVRLFKPLPVTDGCGRSEEKVHAMLRGLGRKEVEATLAEHGVVKVHDELCNQEYRFTAADVARLFEGA